MPHRGFSVNKLSKGTCNVTSQRENHPGYVRRIRQGDGPPSSRNGAPIIWNEAENFPYADRTPTAAPVP